MIKNPKINFNKTQVGHFQIIPNELRKKEEHIPILDLCKMGNRNYLLLNFPQPSHLRATSMERRPEKELSFKVTKGTYRGVSSTNSTQNSIPSIMLKHVPVVKMSRITWREELFD